MAIEGIFASISDIYDTYGAQLQIFLDENPAVLEAISVGKDSLTMLGYFHGAGEMLATGLEGLPAVTDAIGDTVDGWADSLNLPSTDVDQIHNAFDSIDMSESTVDQITSWAQDIPEVPEMLKEEMVGLGEWAEHTVTLHADLELTVDATAIAEFSSFDPDSLTEVDWSEVVPVFGENALQVQDIEEGLDAGEAAAADLSAMSAPDAYDQSSSVDDFTTSRSDSPPSTDSTPQSQTITGPGPTDDDSPSVESNENGAPPMAANDNVPPPDTDSPPPADSPPVDAGYPLPGGPSMDVTA